MKKQTLLIVSMAFAMLSVLNSFAQTVEMKPLFEQFTSSTCPGCNYGNQVLDSVLNNNDIEDYSLIKYQVQWPGEGDPYYIQAAGDRVTYYNVTSVPALFVNNSYMLPWDMTQDVFDANSGDMTSLNILVNTAEVTEAGMINIDVELEVDADYAAGLTLQVVVVEKITVGNIGDNLEKEFHNVMLHMFPDADGTSLGELSVGNNEMLNYTYDMSQTFMEQASDLRVIVFVQDDADHSIIQSEMVDVTPLFDTYTATFEVMDCAGNAIVGAAVELQGIGTLLTDLTGQTMYEGLTNGDYNYDVSAAGLFPNTGSITIADGNTTEDVVLDVPQNMFYEDFTNDIPADWYVYAEASSDYLYVVDGQVIFFLQSDGTLPIVLVTPAINVDAAEILTFDLGQQDGVTNPECGFGYLTDPTDPATYVELEVYAVGTNMETIEYNVAGLSGDIHFAWKHNGGIMSGSFYRLDNVILTGESSIAPPGGLSSYVEENIDVVLNWPDYSCVPVIDGFSVYRSVDGGDYEMISSGLSESIYYDNDLDVGQYEYYVTVTIDGTESEASNIVSAEIVETPPAPQNLTLELDDFYALTLNWDAYSKGFEFFTVYRSVDGAAYEVVASDLTENTYSESDLEDALYEYYVTAKVDGIESGASNVVSMLITSVDDISKAKTEVYPNPASDRISIISDLAIEELKIFNQSGQLVLQERKNSHSFNQDISELRNGVYMIQLKTTQTIITKRLIVK